MRRYILKIQNVQLFFFLIIILSGALIQIDNSSEKESKNILVKGNKISFRVQQLTHVEEYALMVKKSGRFFFND